MGDYINNPQFMKYHYDISKYTTLGPATNALQIFRRYERSTQPHIFVH